MTRVRVTRRGYLLVHVVAMLPIAALLLLVLGKLILDSFYIQRVAAEHGRITAAGEALIERLRADALAARTWTLDGGLLRLDTLTPDGARVVEYHLTPERVIRRSAERAEQHWFAPRLQFDWHLETGGRAGRVLWLDLHEMPPARKTGVLVKQYAASIYLPAPSAGTKQETRP